MNTRQAITNRELWEILRGFVPPLPKHWNSMRFVLTPAEGFVKWTDETGEWSHWFDTLEALKLGSVLVQRYGLPMYSQELSVDIHCGLGIPEITVKMLLSKDVEKKVESGEDSVLERG